MGSGAMWDKAEDEALCRSWMAANEDAINGTGQKASKFWGRVFEIYVGLIPDGKERTSTACTARWGTISHEVTKFCALFAQVTAVEKTGWTEYSYFVEAMELFKSEGKGKKLGREFAFEGCWRILKEDPKWKGGCSYIRDRKRSKGDDLDLRTVRAKAAKKEKQFSSARLVIKQKHVMIVEKQVKTQRDEFLFKIFSMNRDSEQAKRWFAVKAQEAMDELDEIGKPPPKKATNDLLDAGSSVEIEMTTSHSSSTDDDDSILDN